MGKAEQAFRSRIVGEGMEAPDQLLANPMNWRRHPKMQADALEGMLRAVGWVQRVIVNRRTGHIVDGHLRVEVALRRDEPAVPVLYVDLTEAEEKTVLAAIDPIGGLAEADQGMLDQLLEGLTTGDAALDAFLDTLRTQDMDIGEPAIDAPALADRFLIPPFSVLNAREGWWQDRKRQWLALGIRSEVGRGENLLKMSDTVLDPDGSKGRNKHGRAFNMGMQAGPENGWTTEDDLGNGTSIFDPVLCEIAYRWFSPQGGTVIDPFAGGSVRGIVASRLGRRYIGHELRAEQVAANRTQAAELCPDMPPSWIEGDSRGIDRSCADVQADMLLTCPPYADLEVYSDDPADLSQMRYPEFLEAYREIIAKACALLVPDRFAVCVVGEVRDKRGAYRDFVGDTVQAFRDAGMAYYNEAILVTAAGSLPIRAGKQFSTSRKLGKTHQNVLVFVKGDGKRAAEACGEVDVVDALSEPAESLA